MAKVIYCPDNDMPASTEQFGYSFDGGNAVEVTDDKHLAKFSGNPFFAVETPKIADPLKSHKL